MTLAIPNHLSILTATADTPTTETDFAIQKPNITDTGLETDNSSPKFMDTVWKVISWTAHEH